MVFSSCAAAQRSSSSSGRTRSGRWCIVQHLQLPPHPAEFAMYYSAKWWWGPPCDWIEGRPRVGRPFLCLLGGTILPFARAEIAHAKILRAYGKPTVAMQLDWQKPPSNLTVRHRIFSRDSNGLEVAFNVFYQGAIACTSQRILPAGRYGWTGSIAACQTRRLGPSSARHARN